MYNDGWQEKIDAKPADERGGCLILFVIIPFGIFAAGNIIAEIMGFLFY